MTRLHRRVVALERQRGETGQYSEETEAQLRRLKRCGRTRKELDTAFAHFAEATGRAGMDFEAFFALALAERVELTKSAPVECAALAEAYARWRAAFEDERRHHKSRTQAPPPAEHERLRARAG